MADSGQSVTLTKDTHTGVTVERTGAALVLTLDRGRALNALTPAMIATLDSSYRLAARDAGLYVVLLRSADPKAFSAGGDVRALSALARHDLPAACAAVRAEYAFNWLHECFSKPTVAWLDGLVMGSGAGVSTYATHRVATPRYRFAMPETAIGFFPDVGVAHVLARMPHRIGVYLGLTGHSIGADDAFALGLVTHCIEAGALAEIAAGLARADPVDPLLDRRHVAPSPGPVMAHAGMIERVFSAPTVEEIIRRLDDVQGDARAFAQAARSSLLRAAPVALKVTLRHIVEAAALDLRQTLEVDVRLACRFLAAPDFHEGVRAALIDKDQSPRWRPAALADVTPHIIEDYFATLGQDGLSLPLRQEMQAGRV